MTDYQAKRLAKLARDYMPLFGGDMDAQKVAQTILPILRDAILEAVPETLKRDAERLAREFTHTAGAYVTGTYNTRFVPWMS